MFNRLDLDGDRQPETLVALLGQHRCGKEGCPVLLLRSVGDRLIPLQTITGLRSSLVVSERRSHGWQDLILPSSASPGPASLRLAHDGARYPSPSEAAGTEVLDQPTRGVTALALRTSPYLVQGHPLPCPPLQRDQRKRVLSRDPTARPKSSVPLGPAVGVLSRPTVWVATRLMSAQRKIPVTP